MLKVAYEDTAGAMNHRFAFLIDPSPPKKTTFDAQVEYQFLEDSLSELMLLDGEDGL